MKRQRPSPFMITVSILCFCILMQAFSNGATWFTAKNTNKIVKDIERRNSPETQSQQNKMLEAVINRVVSQVDCNSRAAIEDALNDLSDDFPGVNDVNITKDTCEVSTTTTSP